MISASAGMMSRWSFLDSSASPEWTVTSRRTVEPTLPHRESNIRAARACPAPTGTLTAAHEDTHLTRFRF
jgi:hypothetical protein